MFLFQSVLFRDEGKDVIWSFGYLITLGFLDLIGCRSRQKMDPSPQAKYWQNPCSSFVHSRRDPRLAAINLYTLSTSVGSTMIMARAQLEMSAASGPTYNQSLARQFSGVTEIGFRRVMDDDGRALILLKKRV